MAYFLDSKRKVFSLQAITSHELAKLYWGDHVLVWVLDDDERDFLDFWPEEQEKVENHRRTVLQRISENFSDILPKALVKLNDAVFLLDRGYGEALAFTERQSTLNKLVTPCPLTIGSYSAKNFIDPSGRFDEVAWARHLVDDEKRSKLCRFELACFYCFEESIRSLWLRIVNEGKHPYEGSFKEISDKFNFFVAIWVHLLEGRYDQLMVGDLPIFQDGFNIAGFRLSMEQHNLHAARFFWDGCSDEDRDCLKDPIYEYIVEGSLTVAVMMGYGEFVHYIYSLLTPSQKADLFSVSYVEQGDDFLWKCLLLSPSSESVMNDILAAPFSAGIYTLLVRGLAWDERPLQEHRDTFDALWNSLTEEQRKNVLESSRLLLHNVIEEQDIDLLQTLIQPLSPAVKERMLLGDWGRGGITAVNHLSYYGSYDKLRRYLLLLLVDSETERLRPDLLDDFLAGECFVDWMKKENVPQYRKSKVLEVVECVRSSSQVLLDLLEQVVAEEIDRMTDNDFSAILAEEVSEDAGGLAS